MNYKMMTKPKTKTYRQRDNDDKFGKKTHRMRKQTDEEIKKELKEFQNANKQI